MIQILNLRAAKRRKESVGKGAMNVMGEEQSGEAKDQVVQETTEPSCSKRCCDALFLKIEKIFSAIYDIASDLALMSFYSGLSLLVWKIRLGAGASLALLCVCGIAILAGSLKLIDRLQGHFRLQEYVSPEQPVSWAKQVKRIFLAIIVSVLYAAAIIGALFLPAITEFSSCCGK